MTFSKWKNKSKVFNMWKDRAENHGIDLYRCCKAAYEAGRRDGTESTVQAANAAIRLNALIAHSKGK